MTDNQNKNYFNFDDKQKPYYLKNFLSKDCFYMFPHDQIWNFGEFGEICNKVLHYSRQFYKTLKTIYLERRSQSTSREEKIKNDIKLGIISSMKSKKDMVTESKYLEEAYELLCDRNFDLTTYKFINQPLNIVNVFYEIRAIGDWLFFKSNNFHRSLRKMSSNSLTKNKSGKENSLKNNKIDSVKINEIIRKTERHISYLRNTKYYEDGDKDYFHFIEYFWLVQRYKNLTDYIGGNINSKLTKKSMFQIERIYFKEIYNVIRMIKFFGKYLNENIFNSSKFKFKDKEIDIPSIKEEENMYLGKPPIYSFIDDENSKEKEIIGFNSEIYIKKFILNNGINYNEMRDNFKNKYLNSLSLFLDKFREYFKNEQKKEEIPEMK